MNVQDSTVTDAPYPEVNDGLDRSRIVVVDHVTKDFGGKRAVSDLTFDVPARQICGLLGPNGAGKTTFFRLLMGILKATSGSLRICGLEAFEDRVAAKRLIGYLPDEPVFYSYLSARETLELSASNAPDLTPTRQWVGWNR